MNTTASHHASTSKLQFGTVLYWDMKKKQGRILPDGWANKQGLPFFVQGQEMVAGVNEPEFTDVFLRGNEYIPRGKDRVVFVTAFGKMPDRPNGPSVLMIKTWAFEFGYQKLVLEIAHRPRFRVVQNVDSGNGVMVLKEIATGSVEQLMAVSVRDGLRVSTKDIFASIYKNGDKENRNHWQQEDSSGQWVNCGDPRPFPEGDLYRFMLFERERGREIARGTMLELQFRSSRSWKKDRFAAVESKEGQPRRFTWWEKLCPAVGGAKVWVQVNDPRPEPKAKPTTVPMQATQAKTVRPKEQTFKDLSSLDVGLVIA